MLYVGVWNQVSHARIKKVCILVSMKPIFAIVSLAIASCGGVYAQGTFRILDTNMTDVTGGVLYIADTNASVITANFSVENTDTIWHEVTAGRLVISQPATASNAFSWGPNNYAPTVDSSAISESMAPSGTAAFQGNYFPNGNGGLATINYCFWQTTDMNNSSCVTVTFDNYFPAGTAGPIETGAPIISYWPNPAQLYLGIGWSSGTMNRIDMYSSEGKLMSSVTSVTGFDTYNWDLTGLPEGIYYIHCSDLNGFSINFTFVHVSE